MSHRDLSLGSKILKRTCWDSLITLTDYVCPDCTVTEQSTVLLFITTIIRSAIVCIHNDSDRCWSIHSKNMINSILRDASSGFVDITSIKQYMRMLLLFDTIGMILLLLLILVVLDDAILQQWAQLLAIAIDEAELSIIISLLTHFTHLVSHCFSLIH